MDRSGETGAGLDPGSCGKFGATDFCAIRGPHTKNTDAAVGASDGETFGIDLDDLAHLPTDAVGLTRGQRLGVKDLQFGAVVPGPGAGPGVAAPDEIVD